MRESFSRSAEELVRASLGFIINNTFICASGFKTAPTEDPVTASTFKAKRAPRWFSPTLLHAQPLSVGAVAPTDLPPGGSCSSGLWGPVAMWASWVSQSVSGGWELGRSWCDTPTSTLKTGGAAGSSRTSCRSGKSSARENKEKWKLHATFCGN